MSDPDPTTDPAQSSPSPGEQPWLEVVGSRYLLDWLEENSVSLAFTTYQTGKVFFVGRKPDKKLGVFERTFAHSMGLWAAADARTLWMSSRYQLWRFDNVLAGGEKYKEFDALYLPRVGHTTGHLDVHDLAVDQSGRVIFVNTMFCCLATLSDVASFQALSCWPQPKRRTVGVSPVVGTSRSCRTSGLTPTVRQNMGSGTGNLQPVQIGGFSNDA